MAVARVGSGAGNSWCRPRRRVTIVEREEKALSLEAHSQRRGASGVGASTTERRRDKRRRSLIEPHLVLRRVVPRTHERERAAVAQRVERARSLRELELAEPDLAAARRRLRAAAARAAAAAAAARGGVAAPVAARREPPPPAQPSRRVVVGAAAADRRRGRERVRAAVALRVDRSVRAQRDEPRVRVVLEGERELRRAPSGREVARSVTQRRVSLRRVTRPLDPSRRPSSMSPRPSRFLHSARVTRAVIATARTW